MYHLLLGYPLWVWGLTASAAILVGIAAARRLTLTPEQCIMRGRCPDCGCEKLLLTPKSRNHILFECEDCGLTMLLESNDPTPQPAFKPTKVTSLGLVWDGKTGNPKFITGEGHALFSTNDIPLYALAEVNHPQQALQILVDRGVKPYECVVRCRDYDPWDDDSPRMIQGMDAWPSFLESAGIEVPQDDK